MSLLEQVRWLPGSGELRAELSAARFQQRPELLAVRALTGVDAVWQAADCPATGPLPPPRTVRQLSADRLRAVPVSGEWTARTAGRLLEGLLRLSAVVPIAAVDTGSFAAPDTPERALRDFLDTGLPPLWMSTHKAIEVVFVGGLLRGPEAVLACVLDTRYAGNGDQAHLQPLPHLVAALVDPRMLLVVPAGEVAHARRIVAGAGLRAWDADDVA